MSNIPFTGSDPMGKLKPGNMRVILLSATPKREFGCHFPGHVRTARDVATGTITTSTGTTCTACASLLEASGETPSPKRHCAAPLRRDYVPRSADEMLVPDLPSNISAATSCIVCLDTVSAEDFAVGAVACKPPGAGSDASGRHVTCSSCVTAHIGHVLAGEHNDLVLKHEGMLWCAASEGANGCSAPPFHGGQISGPAMQHVAHLRRLYLELRAAAAVPSVESEINRWHAEGVSSPHCPNPACGAMVHDLDGCLWVKCFACSSNMCIFCMDVFRVPGDPLYNDLKHCADCGIRHGADGYMGDAASIEAAKLRHAKKRIPKFLATVAKQLRHAFVANKFVHDQMEEMGLDTAEMLNAAAEL